MKAFKQIRSKFKYWWALYNAYASTRVGENPEAKLPIEYRWKPQEIEEVNQKMIHYMTSKIPEDIKTLSQERAMYHAVHLLKYAQTHPLFKDFVQLHVNRFWIPQSRYHFTIPENLYAIQALTEKAAQLLEYSMIDDYYQLDIAMATKIRDRGFDVGILSQDAHGTTSFFTSFNKENHTYLMEFGRVN